MKRISGANRSNSRITIREVAKAAGVSTATVSHVINNTGSVSQSTRLKVESAIQNMRWIPNVNARRLATLAGF